MNQVSSICSMYNVFQNIIFFSTMFMFTIWCFLNCKLFSNLYFFNVISFKSLFPTMFLFFNKWMFNQKNFGFKKKRLVFCFIPLLIYLFMLVIRFYIFKLWSLMSLLHLHQICNCQAHYLMIKSHLSVHKYFTVLTKLFLNFWSFGSG